MSISILNMALVGLAALSLIGCSTRSAGLSGADVRADKVVKT